MFITFNKWILSDIYEDDGLYIGKMIQNPIEPSELIEQIKTSPIYTGYHFNNSYCAPKNPEIVFVFKQKDKVPNIEITEEKISSIEATVPFKYNATGQDREKLSICDMLSRSMNKATKRVDNFGLYNLFTVGIQKGDSLSLYNSYISDLSRAAKITKNETNTYTIQWETSENAAWSVIFINAYETIQLSLANKDRFAKNIQEIYGRMNKEMRLSADYIVVPNGHQSNNSVYIQPFPNMTCDEMVIWFGSERRGTKLDTFVSSIRGLAYVGSSAYIAIQSFIGKQFLFHISDSRSLMTKVKTMPLDMALMLSSYCKIISTSENSHGKISLIGEVKTTQCDDLANVLYSFMEKNKGNTLLACIDANNFDTMITHFLATYQ